MKLSLSSEWLKTKRTSYRYVILALPFIFNILVLTYFLLSKSTGDIPKVMQNYFTILVMSLPFAFIIVGTLIYEIDKDAGFYKNIIHSNKDAIRILNLKFLFYYLQLAVMYLISIMISLGLIYYFTPTLSEAVLLEYSKMFIQVWLFSSTMVIISNFISVAFSFITSLVIGATFTLMTAIIGMTGLGEGIWVLFPFTWAFRFLFLPLENWALILLWVVIPYLIYLINRKMIVFFKLST